MPLKISDKFRGEIAGSIADLGTLLPYLIGSITIAGMDSTGVLVCFGLMYLATARFYHLPMPVQPMKVIGAAIMVNALTPGEAAASGMIMGIVLLFLAYTGIADSIARLTPRSVTLGIQAGLGISLSLLGMKLLLTDWLLGLIILLLMLVLLNNKRFPASIIALIGGTALAFALHPELSFPQLSWGFHLPSFSLPGWSDYYRGFYLGFLPQLPLTITNSVLVTTILAHELFPDKKALVTEKKLCLTLGFGNLLAAPFGGYPMCHGSGGLAAHYRFGARTEISIVLIGATLLTVGLFLGASALQLLQLIPPAVLGGLLFFSGVELIRPVKIQGNNEVFTFVIVLILSVALNPGIAFLAGVPLVLLLQKGWLRI